MLNYFTLNVGLKSLDNAKIIHMGPLNVKLYTGDPFDER